jgi:thioredoxin 1
MNQLVGPIFKQVSEDFPSDKVRFVKVDTDIHEATVEKYNIQGLPLFGVFIDGEIVLSHSGALNRDALRDLVTRGILHGHQL